MERKNDKGTYVSLVKNELASQKQELTVQYRHSLVCCIEATVCHTFISHEHHCHVGARGGQVWREGGATKPETEADKSCFRTL